MSISLVHTEVKFLEDTNEWYAWSDSVSGAHAVGDTPQDALANLSDILPDLMHLQQWKQKYTTTSQFSVDLPVAYG